MASVLESRKKHLNEKKETLEGVSQNLEYLVNPSYMELMNFCRVLNINSHQMARITIDQNNGDFYVWDSFLMIHNDFHRRIGVTPYAKYGISVQIHDNIAYFSSDVSDELSVKLLDIHKKNKNFMNAFSKIKDMIVLKSGGMWNPSLSYGKISKSYYTKNKSDVDNNLRYLMYTKEDNNNKDNIESFFNEFWKISKPHLFDDKARIINNTSVTLFPVSGEIHISDIRALIPNQGNATKVLETLKMLANKYNVVLSGIAIPYLKDKKYITKKNDLVNWYKKHGFTVKYGENLKYIPKRIDEQFGGAFDYYGEEVRYWKNPMPQEIQSLVASGINEFRIVVLQYSPTIYVFDARAATHGDFCSAVGIYMNSIIQGFMSYEQTGEFLIQAYVHEDLAELEKNPNIRRIMSGLNAKGQVLESNTVLSVRKKHLNEKIAKDFEGSNETLVNPTIKELAAFIIRNSNPLRFAVEENTGNIYFWDAWRITHGSFRRQNNLRLILYNINHVITSLPTDIGGGLSLDYDSGKFIIYSDSFNFQKSGEELYNIYKKYPKFNKLFSNTPFTKYYEEEQELHEQYGGKFDSYGVDVKYWKNPSPKELENIIKNSPWNIARISFDNHDNVYAFNGADSFHYKFYKETGIEESKKHNFSVMVRPENGQYKVVIEFDPLKYYSPMSIAEKLLMNNHNFVRMFGGKPVEYIEEEQEVLAEAKVDIVTVGWNDRQVKVYINPTPQEVKILLGKARYNELRFLEINNNVYIWESYISTHAQLAYHYDPINGLHYWEHYNCGYIVYNAERQGKIQKIGMHTNKESYWKRFKEAGFVFEAGEGISEQYIGNFDSTKVYKNPTNSELKAIFNNIKKLNSGDSAVRMDVDIDKNIYIWDAYEWTHDNMRINLGFNEKTWNEKQSVYTIVKKPNNNHMHMFADTESWGEQGFKTIQRNPNFIRAMKGFTFDYDPHYDAMLWSQRFTETKQPTVLDTRKQLSEIKVEVFQNYNYNVKVYTNLTPAEVITLLYKSKNTMLRFIECAGKVYIWDAYFAEHMTVYNKFLHGEGDYNAQCHGYFHPHRDVDKNKILISAFSKKSDLTYWNAFRRNNKFKLTGMLSEEQEEISEEAPTTNAGSGAIAGLGIGPHGEPGRINVMNYRKMLRRNINDNKKRIANQKDISKKS